ncbi:hypothetical protein P170DRAFT_477349 [Aspergillus steynii IBT 23096]|uniref:Uncharacterized protein n=1 Tax=Aspergillus steynii IBT 23096 TaxID=1392250 RepID=A0A2I2G0R7_9EURO|nr:uncharacterized protein P170DRAFT_477349 [Aspergillus steynii IBT 23096]PLB46469.1 hypothetical protein P170DRAFT_477349 [Aspergillus steynii IBT 23096]
MLSKFHHCSLRSTLSQFVLSLCFLQFTVLAPPVEASSIQPSAPGLSFLYTAYVECKGNLMEAAGPHGIRRAIPIVGGNFTGPRISGEILDLGADWGLVDPKTNIFSADTRYNLRTNDGADIFIQTAGPKSPSGQLHLRLIFETGSEKYYWLNNIVAIGVLTPVQRSGDSSVLRIDAWNFASDWNSTTFVGNN